MSVPRLLITVGVLFIVAGLVAALAARLSIRLFHLPGDFVWRGKHTVLYFPLATCLLLSVLLTLVFWLAGKR